MIGVGGRPFIDDWALAAEGAATVIGMKYAKAGAPFRVRPDIVLVAHDPQSRYEVRAMNIAGAPTFVSSRLRTSAILSVARRVQAEWGPIDLIHSHFYASALGVREASYRMGIPYVHTEHSSWLTMPRAGRGVSARGLRTLRHIAAGAFRVFAVSESLLQAMRTLGVSGSMEVLANPVNTRLFSPTSEKRTNQVRMVTVGNLIRLKRHDLLLRAFARASVAKRDIHLTVVGDGPLRGVLESLANALGIAERTRFTGNITRAEVADELRRSDLYVHASEVETFGVALVEALASGLPIVTSRCGGVLDSMAGGFPVTVVDSESEHAFAAALVSAIDSLPQHDRAITAEIAERDYGIAAVSGRLRAVYSEALASRLQ